MKTTKLFALAIAVLGFSVSSFAQNSASATATAGGTIITPIAISKTTDMQFGTVVANATSAGTVKMNLDGTATYSTVMAFSGAAKVAPSIAEFSVTGNANNAITVTLSNLPTEVAAGSETMSLTDWNSNATGSTKTGTATLSADGKYTVKVGATLNVKAAQKAGSYTSSAFTVAVNYN